MRLGKLSVLLDSKMEPHRAKLPREYRRLFDEEEFGEEPDILQALLQWEERQPTDKELDRIREGEQRSKD